MNIKLSKPLASNGGADEYDVRQVKHALNRLGYYSPHEKSGMTSIPDRETFAALKAFQADQNLTATGTMKPGDETEKRLNSEAEKTSGQYIWRCVDDERVRPAHAKLNGTVRNWDDSPDPTEDYNCRCWAEPVKDAINPVYPELILIPAFKIGRIIALIRRFFANNNREKFTDHGNVRSNQRNISPQEIQRAIDSAKKSGNVTTKTGKYGTSQNHYKGNNGVTVVEETAGRNAGKIITTWRH
jgi:peptidoglycan hydrolase-like protein with peptidoglycan-binding domain